MRNLKKSFLSLTIGFILLVPMSSQAQDGAKPNLVGKWKGSPDCIVVISKDNGDYVEAKCDTECCIHRFRGNWFEESKVRGTMERIDPTGCTIRVNAMLSVIDENAIKYNQQGWHGCGVNTGEGGGQLWRRQ